MQGMCTGVSKKPDAELKVGDLVEFAGEDSYFKGRIVSLFRKLPKDFNVEHAFIDNGPLRCVVQDDRGLLLIKDPKRGRKI